MKRLAVYESILAIAAIGVLILAGAAWDGKNWQISKRQIKAYVQKKSMEVNK